jgi:predicted nucleic acid-binding protein
MIKSTFKKGIDNLRFALNIDDYIPEHLMDELRNEQEFLNENENLDDVDEFNSEVEQIFSKSRPKPKIAYNVYNQKQIPFDDIIGYDDLKELLTKCLVINDNCNILLSGPPSIFEDRLLTVNTKRSVKCLFHRCSKCFRAWIS